MIIRSKFYSEICCHNLRRCLLVKCQSVHRRIYPAALQARLFGTLTKKDTSGSLPEAYFPKDVENQWYDWWEQQSYFQEKQLIGNNKFTILFPPPNVTGNLHLGHALTVTIQDVLARWKRMQGQNVVWIPGVDHAGIATQVVVEKNVWKQQKLNRHQLGREKFLREVQNWHQQKSSQIQNQLKSLGASLDWCREYFTMDEQRKNAVTEAFIRLFDDGLIYQSDSLVNWSCWLQSTISDVEVEKLDIKDPSHISVPGYSEPIEFGVLTEFAYKLCDKEGEIVVSTTRPETMLGDVAVAVHPDDSRYSSLRGHCVWHPYRNEKIPIIFDNFVDQYFGTGAVKITPAHDPTDYEVAKRHKLKMISVINEKGIIENIVQQFAGEKRFDLRKKIRADLSKRGLLRANHPHATLLPVCSRSGDVIEYILKPQWFLNTSEMARKATNALEKGEIEIIPQTVQKDWLLWFREHKDWCLSRQIWWGHPIPVYKCCNLSNDESVWIAARNADEARHKAAKALNCKNASLDLTVTQDNDVLDTWFSSALLPFSSLGWPNQTKDLLNLYPLSLMETGNDILLFWVSRMVILGHYFMGKLPFNKVFLHGVICDSLGRKMSKSLGNVISPEDIREGVSLKDLLERTTSSYSSGAISEKEFEHTIAYQKKSFPKGIPECGTDALRFTLCSRDLTSRFIEFSVDECQTNRFFCNKIWQVCRYIEKNTLTTRNMSSLDLLNPSLLGDMDLWILSRLSACISTMNGGLENMSLHICFQSIKQFVYEFCDTYVEYTKHIFKSDDFAAKEAAQIILIACIRTVLVAIAPFMPFLSEELFHRMPGRSAQEQSVTLMPYPSSDMWSKWRNEKVEENISTVVDVITAIRKSRLSHKLSNKTPITIDISSRSIELLDIVNKYNVIIELMTNCVIANTLDITTSSHENEIVELTNFTVTVQLTDYQIEEIRRKEERETVLSFLRKYKDLSSSISKLEKMVNSPKFSYFVPDHKQTSTRETLTKLLKVNDILNKNPALRSELLEQVNRESLQMKKMNEERWKKKMSLNRSR